MTLTLSAEEQIRLEEIRRAGAYRTDEAAVRGALFWYGRFLDVDIPPECFALAPDAPAPSPDQPDLFDEWGS